MTNSNKMRILFVQETDWLKRNPIIQHHLAEMLSLRGHEVRVIDYELLWRNQGKRQIYSKRQVFSDVHKVHSDEKVIIIRPGIIKIPILEYVSILFSHRREIDRQMREFSPDVVVGWYILNAYLAMKAAKRYGVPFIYFWTDVNHLAIPFKPLRSIGKMVESRTLKQSDMVLGVSDEMAHYVIANGAPKDQTFVLKSGVSLEKFSPSVSGLTARKQYGIGELDIVLFFMGWLYDFSGLDDVIVSLAQDGYANMKLLIVGEGDAFDKLDKLKSKYNLDDIVILTGQKSYSEIPELVSASDICLLPANPAEKLMHEGIPAKLYEYMAMSKPVISTRLQGVIKEFGEGNGVIYVDNPKDVIEKAKELIDSGMIEETGARARKFIKKYSWDSVVDKFEDMLKEIVLRFSD